MDVEEGKEDCEKIAQSLHVSPEKVLKAMQEVAEADHITPAQAARICRESLPCH